MNKMAMLACCKYLSLKERAVGKLKEERGDTNFLSIMIILGIVLLLAGAFFVFKDEITGFLGDAWDTFSDEADPTTLPTI
jgi:hypothetical protein